MIEAGAKAPSFTLPDQDGNEVSLDDFAGRKLVLVFYPLDFSPVCTDQLSIYEGVLEEIRAKGAEIAGISVDSSFAHAAFREKLGVTFPLLADFNPKGAVAEAYGAYMPEAGHANRSLVVIDENGVVAWSHAMPSPLEIPPAEMILDALG
jgi:peroxiredoxin